MYKGNEELSHQTTATGAVGLGDANLFQSFMVCSNYATDYTALTFSKVKAGPFDL